MLTNRPEFHSFDAAAMHLGATPFSIYNTYTRRADRSTCRATPSTRIVVTEQAFLDTVTEARGACGTSST